MNILIPMAGRGERFAREGYALPKPLLPINDCPMVVAAIQSLPQAENIILVALEEHLQTQPIQQQVQQYFPKAQFVSISDVTDGQASTCQIGIEKSGLKGEVLISACDNGMLYNEDGFNQVKQSADVVVFTFRNNPTVVHKPEQYGWVKVDEKGKVLGTSVKKAISDNPIKDHAIVGTFWFREESIYSACVNQMKAERRTINGEYYVDECINDAVNLGYRVSIFEIDKYICWGTPNDYKTFYYWQDFFKK